MKRTRGTYKYSFFFLLFPLILSCSQEGKKDIPVIGFLDLLQDETLAQAKNGFMDALKTAGYSEAEKNIHLIYRNAQGDQPSLLQGCDYMLSQHVDLIATNPTLSTIAAVQKTKTVPIFMMVSPRPDIAGLTGKNEPYPPNLFGVYETLDYIDTSLLLIRKIFPAVRKIGVLYNQSEPQSVDALEEISRACRTEGIELVSQPVTATNETQLVVQSLLSRQLDAFFALPDNIVFSSMEVIVKSCDNAKVPVFTSEEGLVKRGALAAFGADMYQWGYQSGLQAASFLKTKSLAGLRPEIVKIRRKVYNPEKATQFRVRFDSTFVAVR
jgi:putative ABC transport system substrate-binding protein